MGRLDVKVGACFGGGNVGPKFRSKARSSDLRVTQGKDGCNPRSGEMAEGELETGEGLPSGGGKGSRDPG